MLGHNLLFKVYSAKANELKIRSDKEKLHFKQSLTEKQELVLNLLNLNRQAENGIITRRNLDPKQKALLDSLPISMPLTPRGVFLSQRLKGVPGSVIKTSDSLAEAMKEWSNMSIQEQEPFAKQAESNLKGYTESISNFLQH